MRRSGGSAAVALFGFIVLLAGAGCTAAPPSLSTVTPTDTAAPAASSPPAASDPPGFSAGRSAAENLAVFDAVNGAVVAANEEATGREFIDALAAAGFDKATMQVTDDFTTLGLPADSLQFSVLVQGECLVGQFGPSSGGYHGVVRPALGTGGCLVGDTRPIDW